MPLFVMASCQRIIINTRNYINGPMTNIIIYLNGFIGYIIFGILNQEISGNWDKIVMHLNKGDIFFSLLNIF